MGGRGAEVEGGGDGSGAFHDFGVSSPEQRTTRLRRFIARALRFPAERRSLGLRPALPERRIQRLRPSFAGATH